MLAAAVCLVLWLCCDFSIVRWSGIDVYFSMTKRANAKFSPSPAGSLLLLRVYACVYESDVYVNGTCDVCDVM